MSYKADDIESRLKPGVSFYGMQGHLWSEMLRSDKQAEYMLYPRLLALAERAWHRASWELPYDYKGKVYSKETQFFDQTHKQQREADWQRFVHILGYRELAKLELDGIFYRVPMVASRTVDKTIDAFTAIPNFKLQYLDEKGVWHEYVSQSQAISKAVKVRATNQLGTRIGRSLPLL